MTASLGAPRSVRGLLGEVAPNTAYSTRARRTGFAWSTKPAPTATTDLLLLGGDFSRPAWRFLHALDPNRPLSSRQARTLARIATRSGLGPVGS